MGRKSRQERGNLSPIRRVGLVLLCFILVLSSAVASALVTIMSVGLHHVSAQTELTIGVPLSDAMTTSGDTNYYEFVVGAGETLSIVLDGSTSLTYSQNQIYVRYGDLPTTTVYDYKGVMPDSSPDQAVLISSTQAGTYYILAYSFAYNTCCGPYAYTITVHSSSTLPSLTTGLAVEDQMQTGGDANWYQVVVGADETLSIVLDGSTSLTYSQNQIYVGYGDLPTTTVYDFVGGLSASPDQAVLISSTQAGTYYILAYSFAYNTCCGPYGYTITASAGLGGSNSPTQPRTVSPANAATEVSLAPTLEASTFSDPNPGDTHAASQWQITTAAGAYVSPVFNSGADSSNLTSITIPSSVLSGGTTYYWRVRYQDNNLIWSAWSSETSFTTSGDATDPVISGVTATDITATSATITWNTDEVASSQVDYGLTMNYGSSTALDTNVVTGHSVNLTSLTSQTIYHYRVKSRDGSGNEANSADYTFLTTFGEVNQPPAAPVNGAPSDSATGVTTTPTMQASDFSDPDTGDTQAAAQWQVSTTSGDYSRTVFDSHMDSSNLNKLNVPAGVLLSNTTYYWRVRYQDSNGNWSGWSAESSFITSSPPPPPSEDRSFIGSVPRPSEVSTDAGVVGTNFMFTLIFVIVFYFAATVFNGTLKENYEVIQGWTRRVSGRLIPIDHYVREKTRSLPGIQVKANIYASAVIIVIVSAALYCFIEPYFVFNLRGLALFLALALSVGIVTAAYEGVQVVLMARGFRVPAGFMFYWVALVVAAICVGASRVIDFHPGIIYGFVGAATILSVKKPDKRQESLAVLLGTAVLLVVAICAFYLREFIPNAGEEGNKFWVLLADGILAGTFVMGLEGLLFTLLPLPFMDGGKVAAWKWWVAFAALFVVLFFFVWFIINKDGKIVEAAQNMKMVVMVGLMVLSLLVSGAVWLYFLLRHRSLEHREETGPAWAPKGSVTNTMALQVAGSSRGSDTLDEVVQAVASRVEAKDRHTASHQKRVTELAHAIAVELGLSKERSRVVRIAGLLHDLGKTVIPSEILNKPGRLSDTEFATVKTHPRAGYEILKEMQVPVPIADIVAQHHERMDGSGYPSGLKGDQSALEARILAVADVVEAMTSEQPYRPAFSLDKALEEISGKRGKLYDASVVDACLAVFRRKSFRFA